MNHPRSRLFHGGKLLLAALSLALLPVATLAALNPTQIRTKTYGPYAFEKVACGDFFGIGVASVAVMKQTHSQIIFMNTTSGTTTSNTLGSFDVGTTAGYDILGIVAGDVDGDGKDELVVLRNAPSTGANVLVYDLTLNVDASGVPSVTASLKASLRIGSGVYGWRGVACGDFDGDGKDEILVLKDTHSQFIMYDVSGTTLVQKAFLNLPDGGTSAGINDWRGVAIGDLDGDGVPEIVAARYASGTDPDILVYKVNTSGTWTFTSAGTFNSTTHYPWAGVAIGEFDNNPANGNELVLCKNTSPFFNFYDYVNSTTLTGLGGYDFQSSTANPWTAIAAGKMSLRATGDCLISIRQSAPAGQALEAIYGDEATYFNGKKAALQKNGFSFGAYHQALFRLSTDNSQLDVTALKNFIIANKLKTFEPILADLWTDPTGLYHHGREYVNIVELIDQLAAAGSECQIIPLLVPPTEIANNSHYTPYPGDSPHIGAAELGGGITDESTLFGTAPDYITWFKLISIIAKKYPNNVSGVSIDDFNANRTTFTRQTLGAMIKNLRASTNTVAFMPVVYYSLTTSSNVDYFKDYADGFVFYERNEKTKNATLIVPPDVTRSGTAWNMHGAIVLPSSDISGGLNLANTEVNDVSAWVGNSNSLLFMGIYASTHSQSTTAPTDFTTDHLMKVAKNSTKMHGLMIYTTQTTTSPIGIAVYNNFSTWWGP